jgi:hypothetical protein
MPEFDFDTVVKTSGSEMVVLRRDGGEFKVSYFDLDRGDWRDIRDEFDTRDRRSAVAAMNRQEAMVRDFYL